MFIRRLCLLVLVFCLALAPLACDSDEDDDSGDDDAGDDDDSDDDGPEFSYEPETGPYDFFVVTTPDLLDAVDRFAGFKQSLGMTVEVVSTGDLAGGDLPDAIRDHLIAEYDASRTQYVLIVSSHDEIPMRYFYLEASEHSTGAEYTTTSDYFYGDLDTDWDADGDGYYGEWDDDFSGEWIGSTWDKEIATGRIPWDDPDDVEAILDRIVAYELRTADEGNPNVLLAGGTIQYEGDAPFLMEYIKERIELPPFAGNIYTCYGSDLIAEPDYALNEPQFLTAWHDVQPGFVMWASHGSPTGAYTGASSRTFIDNSVVSDLEDTTPGIVFSTGCNNAVPEEQSLGFTMLRDVSVAFIGSTRETHPGDLGEGAIIVFPFGVQMMLLDNAPIGDAMAASIDYYMETLFGHGDYPAALFFRNIFGFSLLGDPSMALMPE